MLVLVLSGYFSLHSVKLLFVLHDPYFTFDFLSATIFLVSLACSTIIFAFTESHYTDLLWPNLSVSMVCIQADYIFTHFHSDSVLPGLKTTPLPCMHSEGSGTGKRTFDDDMEGREGYFFHLSLSHTSQLSFIYSASKHLSISFCCNNLPSFMAFHLVSSAQNDSAEMKCPLQRRGSRKKEEDEITNTNFYTLHFLLCASLLNSIWIPSWNLTI